MTHSAPPPEPPPIVHIRPAKTQNLVPGSITAPVSNAQSLTATTLSSPPLPKLSPPASAPFGAGKSAAALGSPIAVSYPMQRLETTNAVDDSAAEFGITPQTTQILSASSANTIGTMPTVNKTQRNQATHKGTRPLPITHTSVHSPQSFKRSLGVSLKFNQRVASQELPQTGEGNASDSPNPQQLEFDFSAPNAEKQPVTSPIPAEVQTQPTQQPIQPSGQSPLGIPVEQPTPTPTQTAPQQPTGTPPASRRVVEVSADRQVYDQQRQIVTAEGNVLVRLDGAVLDADRVQVNLENLIAVGEGNVALTRGQQVLRGERFTYNVVQDSGEIQSGSGEVFIPTVSSDFAPSLPTDIAVGGGPARPPSDRITANQPLEQVSSPGGVNFTVGGSRGLPKGGEVRRLRFEAGQIDFDPSGWEAKDVRITNDPFSPPELELRANTVTLTRETPFRDRITTTKQRLVFDQGFSLPIPRNQAVIDRQQRDPSPGIVQFGYDGTDRGGLYIERGFTPINTPALQLSLTPQFFVQQAIAGNDSEPAGSNTDDEDSASFFDPSQFGLKTEINGNFGPRTALRGFGTFTSLDLGDIEDNLRANLQFQQVVGTRLPHTVILEGSYRERIYNGSLGYRTVQSSVGALVNSPIIPLGNSGINLSYQAGYQYINADSDRQDLLEPVRENNRISLSRVQGTAAVSRGFPIWQGKPLPATRNEGLRYSPVPLVPYLSAVAGVTLNNSFYSSGDNQTILTGTVGLQGQFGHFSRSFFDYTAFNVSYSQDLKDGESPFLFDRDLDEKTLSFGLTQQIYGPFRLGVQASLNLDTGESFSTDYVLEYSRRTYGVTLRYNPDLELGSLSLRISDFNWVGGADPFSGTEVRPVVGGVRR